MLQVADITAMRTDFSEFFCMMVLLCRAATVQDKLTLIFDTIDRDRDSYVLAATYTP